jgi:hypothetical protein
MLTALTILAIAALVCTIMAGMGKVQLWVAVLLIAVILCIMLIPGTGIITVR